LQAAERLLDGEDPAGSSPAVRNDFRNNFLRKLSYTGVWVPQARQPPRHGTSIIFDWDDTLLCTSFLTASPWLPGKTRDHLHAITQAGRRVLELSKQLGRVFIVTNATIDWVDYSARKWVPQLLPVIDGVQVISAREKYEAQYPRTIGEWKLQSFLEVQRRLGSDAVTNFVSVGDSTFELEAATAIGRSFPQAVIKTVKFREKPTPKELLRQLELMGSRLPDIVASGTDVQVAIGSRGKSSRASAPCGRDSATRRWGRAMWTACRLPTPLNSTTGFSP
jgi:hypothetical protein